MEAFGKPHASAYEACFAELDGVARDRVVAIGDSLRTDIVGAHAAGIDAVFIAGGIHAAELGSGNGKPLDGPRLQRFIDASGYHSRAVLRALNDSPWKTRIAAPKQTGFSRWHGDEAARRAVTNTVRGSSPGSPARPSSCAPRSSSAALHNLDRGGMRRTWLRGRENVHKRYLLHVAGHNLSLLMRQLIAPAPRGRPWRDGLGQAAA